MPTLGSTNARDTNAGPAARIWRLREDGAGESSDLIFEFTHGAKLLGEPWRVLVQRFGISTIVRGAGHCGAGLMA